MRPDRIGGALAAAVLLTATGPANAAQAVQVNRIPPVELCAPEDSRLSELSGLVSDGARWYAVGDGGSSVRVFELDPATCEVRSVRTAPQNPYDVEDLALRDGTLWLADTGDNRAKREDVALHVLPPGGGAALYRMSYPDGPHDAEALLLDGSGVPHVVTKEPLGTAGVYRPAEPLDAQRTVPMERVGSVSLRSTRTPGGPVSTAVGSVMITGGSVSADGNLVALRTYTEAYVYRAQDGDVLSALESEPVRIPLPDEEQGEAIAWEPGGGLLSGSEGYEPIRRIPGADGGPVTAEEVGGTSPGGEASGESAEDGLSTGSAMLLAGVAAALLMYLIGWRRRRA
ncbi:hypothetical protein GCM10009854_16070 [Saccharopolyspora halophila]|uniref:Esterase-like activity of phytase family protein n=1 Tax=Saccharopolyspora halophila TaxID=405551 RepID=A0ABP5T095_9PSEU